MSDSPKPKKKSEMRTRVVFGVLLAVVSVASLAASRLTRLLYVTLLAFLGCREMCHVLQKYSFAVKEVMDASEPKTPAFKTKEPLVSFSVIGMGILIYLNTPVVWHFGWYFFSVFLLFFAEIVSKNWYIPERARNVIANIFCLTYPMLPFVLLMEIAGGENWIPVILLATLSAMFCDIFALFGGMIFGRHKLASLISPHKTWEGTLCGALFSVLGGLICWVFLKYIPFLSGHELPLGVSLITALIASSFGQVGDLTASLLKRLAGMKDYSHLIPGHGGVMDRFDSLLFAIPATYFSFILFGVL